MKDRLRKIGIICLTLVIALSSVGFSYAKWSESLSISGTANTGQVDWEFTKCSLKDEHAPPPYVPKQSGWCDWTCRDGFAGPLPWFWRLDKNVGWGEYELVDTDADEDFDTLKLALHNVYPSYFNGVSDLWAHNNGSVPIVVQKVVINGIEITQEPVPVIQLDLSGDGKDDIEIWWKDGFGTRIDPGKDIEMGLWFHCLQDAPQGASLSFTISIVAVQWNGGIASQKAQQSNLAGAKNVCDVLNNGI